MKCVIHHNTCCDGCLAELFAATLETGYTDQLCVPNPDGCCIFSCQNSPRRLVVPTPGISGKGIGTFSFW